MILKSYHRNHPNYRFRLSPCLSCSRPLSLALLLAPLLSIAVAAVGYGQDNPPQPSQGGQNSAGPWRGGRGLGAGMGFGGGGIVGTVTQVAGDHYTVKTDSGEIYTIHFSVNTRMFKMPERPQRGQGGQSGYGGERPQPQMLKSTDIKVGDVVTANGEIDATAKSVGALMLVLLDPERAKQMREMQANHGKTWLAGTVTAINETKITIDDMVDHAAHTFVVDENTSFHKRRDSITLADLKTGDQVRIEGAVKDGAFLAAGVSVIEMRPPTQMRGHPGTGPGSEPGSEPGGEPGSGTGMPPPQN